MAKKKVLAYASWDWKALVERVKEEIIKDLEAYGKAVEDAYVLWNFFGPGRYGKRDSRFMRLTINAVKTALQMEGIPRDQIGIRFGRGGKFVITLKR